MKASNLNIAELIQFAPGFVGIQGRRLLIHDLSSLGQFRKDLIETVGEEMARRILTRKGLFWGQADCAALQRLFHWDCKEELIRAGAELIKIIGMAYSEVIRIRLDEKNQIFEMEICCADSVEVEQHRNEMGKANHPICWVMAGYLSGFASYCLDMIVYFSETCCQGTEASNCTFIGKDIDRWGNSIQSELQYFQASDIQKKVQLLSLRIREQQRMLSIKQKQLKAAQNESMLPGIETRSKSYRNVLELSNRVSSFDTTVLITGETGTGKEVLARYIHNNSDRKQKPFIAVNCSALPETLLENELFGHKAGAFTGAKNDEAGLFEAAQKGTIFLDEIGDISLTTQAKLLRVLQSKEIRALGDTNTQQVNVRVISATNRNLDELVNEGKFRKDLLYRLRVVQITIPPLRERPDDILPLARHFLMQFQRKLSISNLRLAAETVDLLIGYHWPGNIRELENGLEHAAILSTDGIITPDNLPGTITGRISGSSPGKNFKPLAVVENEYIQTVLSSTKGSRTETAAILGISESTLYRRIRSFENFQSYK